MKVVMFRSNTQGDMTNRQQNGRRHTYQGGSELDPRRNSAEISNNKNKAPERRQSMKLVQPL